MATSLIALVCLLTGLAVGITIGAAIMNDVNNS